MSDVTRILSEIESGDPKAAEQFLPLVYDELRKLAAAKLVPERPGQTLQATALVHEAYILLVDVDKAQHWNSRGHFFGVVAEAMRRVLVHQMEPLHILRSFQRAEEAFQMGVQDGTSRRQWDWIHAFVFEHGFERWAKLVAAIHQQIHGTGTQSFATRQASSG